VAGIEADEMLGDVSLEFIDLGHRLGEIHNVADGETEVDALLVRLEEQAINHFDGHGLAAAAYHEKMAVTAGDVGDYFGREHLFLAPNHDVLERMIKHVVFDQSLMDDLGVVEES